MCIMMNSTNNTECLGIAMEHCIAGASLRSQPSPDGPCNFNLTISLMIVTIKISDTSYVYFSYHFASTSLFESVNM